MTFIIRKSGIKTGINATAFNALRKARSERVDVVMIGDSNQNHSGKGFDYAINNYLSGKHGTYASPVYCQGTVGTQNYKSFFGELNWASSAINSNHADLFVNNGFGSLEVPTSINKGIICYPNSNFNIHSNLRFWLGWAGYDSGSGTFTPKIRLEQAPWTTLATGTPTSTNTGDFSAKLSYIDIAAGTRAGQIKGGFSVSSDQIVAPFTFLFQRAEDMAKRNGFSCHSLYAVGGSSLYDMAVAMQNYSIGQLTGYFGEIRRLQLANAQRPNVVVYVNSGVNDRNETAASVGEYKISDSSTKNGYVDNETAIIRRIEQVWEYNGWDIGELSFLLVASHVIANPYDAELVLYRDALNELSTRRNNVTAVDARNFMSYSEALDNGWYYGSEVEHLSETGYAAFVSRMFLSI